MGRKPNPVIAAHFIRGEKHRDTTNRYSQTCRHCGTLFSTGRPETLFAHLLTCRGLSELEQANVLSEIQQPSASESQFLDTTLPLQTQAATFNVARQHEFDVSGLDVLAGVAENAEDFVIDPQITGATSTSQGFSTGNQPMTFDDNDFGSTYLPLTFHNWTSSFGNVQDPLSTVMGASDPSMAPPSLGGTAIPVTQFSFMPNMTTPATYTASSYNQVPVSFADRLGSHSVPDEAASITSPGMGAAKSKARKSKAPYNEPKRARVAEMRHVGACVRCSRLRKVCDSTRPCKQCTETQTKTWVGECTSLNKGNEFNTWFGSHLSDDCEMKTMQNDQDHAQYNEDEIKLELQYFEPNGPKILFKLARVESYQSVSQVQSEDPYSATSHYVIHENENVSQRLLDHALENQEKLIERIDTPALYATVRVAQGLSAEQEADGEHQTWGTSEQSDDNLTWIFDLWLLTSLLTTTEPLGSMRFVDSNGDMVVDSSFDSSYSIVASQIDASLETTIQQRKNELRKLDTNIMNNKYKNLCNLAVGIFLILDIIEKYCCFITRHNLTSIDHASMIKQAKTLAEKYNYCVKNIHMMPIITTDRDGLMVAAADEGRVDHGIQRAWIADLNMSKDDLAGYLAGDGDRWVEPTGRLWALLFQEVPGSFRLIQFA